MITIIVNADDFGLSRGVNYGIIDSHLEGIVNSTTMMMNMSGTEHAIALAKQHSSLNVGIHLVLTCGKPLLSDVPSLVDEKGDFKKLSYLMSNPDVSLEDLEREWTAQIETFLASGLKPTHFDSHHHVHTMNALLPVVQKLANKYDLPVRPNGDKKIEGVKAFVDQSLLDFYGAGVTEDYFQGLDERVKDGSTIEIMCHPAYLDNTLLNISSYTHTRLKELDILTKVPVTTK